MTKNSHMDNDVYQDLCQENYRTTLAYRECNYSDRLRGDLSHPDTK